VHVPSLLVFGKGHLFTQDFLLIVISGEHSLFTPSTALSP
jgi:hypothetical protein